MYFGKGKGGRERIVPLTTPAKTVIKDWLKIRKQSFPIGLEAQARSENYLFPSRAKYGHLSRERFAQMLKSLAINAGLPPSKISPHVLRHAFATHLLARGADLRSVQKLLGLAEYPPLKFYTHVLDERMKSLVYEMHPLAKS